MIRIPFTLTKEERRENTLKQWKDPEMRKKMCQGMRRSWKSPKLKLEHGKKIRKRRAKEDVKKQQTIGTICLKFKKETQDATEN